MMKKIADSFKNKGNKDKKEDGLLVNLQARINVSTLSYNNLAMFVDENGEWHKFPIPDPVEEEFLVKTGDQVNGFEVVGITANFIELKSSLEFTEDNASTPKTQFIIGNGESVKLTMSGVYDEVYKTTIRYIETVE